MPPASGAFTTKFLVKKDPYEPRNAGTAIAAYGTGPPRFHLL